ncbi:hypothetical protein ACJ73_06003 [Blastomyces percursus]|uniref:Uncharacterized protein n=1 Tax=Blastomyces percursus TaxID=1658174 RepID=A0A1J9Q295_9EURO|nr:hypothetical protein ACJ73_06003 [Blastomyces percursus]
MCQDDNKIMTVFGDNPLEVRPKTEPVSSASQRIISTRARLSASSGNFQSLLQQTILRTPAPDSGLATYSDGTRLNEIRYERYMNNPEQRLSRPGIQ